MGFRTGWLLHCHCFTEHFFLSHLLSLLSESAPGSPQAGSAASSKTEEPSNLKTLPKGLSTSLPDLDSDSWIEVKKRHRPAPTKPKVSLKSLPHLQALPLSGSSRSHPGPTDLLGPIVAFPLSTAGPLSPRHVSILSMLQYWCSLYSALTF